MPTVRPCRLENYPFSPFADDSFQGRFRVKGESFSSGSGLSSEKSPAKGLCEFFAGRGILFIFSVARDQTGHLYGTDTV